MEEKELRTIVKKSGIKLIEENLVQGTWGNSSVRLNESKMIVTPSGMDYERLTEDDLPIVDIQTLEWTGSHKPTSERKIHAAMYRERPEVGAVIHSHPTYCSILASVGQELPVINEDMQRLIGGNVKVGSYGLPGTKKLTQGTIDAMKDRNACFMANHGVMCVGRDMEEAFETIRVLESACLDYIKQKTLEVTGAKEFSEQLIFDYFSSTINKK